MNISLTPQPLFCLSLACALLFTTPRSANGIYAQGPIQVLVPDPTFGTAGALQLPNDYALTFAQVVSDHAIIRQTITWPIPKSYPDLSNRLCRVETLGQLNNCTEWITDSLYGGRFWSVVGIQPGGRVLYSDSGLKRLNADLSVDATFSTTLTSGPCYSSNYNYLACFKVLFDGRLLTLDSTYEDVFGIRFVMTTTLYSPNGAFEKTASTTNHFASFEGFIDRLAPISASVPISSQLIFLYTHQTPVDVPPCRWEAYSLDLTPLGSVDLIQTQQPCVTTKPVAHPDGGLVWMELARDQNDIELGRQIYKTRPDFSIDTSFGVNGVVTALLTSAGPITSSQILVQPDGRLLTIFEKQEGWLLKQFDRDGSHEQWLGLFASAVAPVLTTEGKIITQHGNVMHRYYKITVASLDQRLFVPVVMR